MTNQFDVTRIDALQPVGKFTRPDHVRDGLLVRSAATAREARALTPDHLMSSPLRLAPSGIDNNVNDLIPELPIHSLYPTNHEEKTLPNNSGTTAKSPASTSSENKIAGVAVSPNGHTGGDPGYPVDFFEDHARSAAVYPEDVEFPSGDFPTRIIQPNGTR
jgi:hypothetical protein